MQSIEDMVAALEIQAREGNAWASKSLEASHSKCMFLLFLYLFWFFILLLYYVCNLGCLQLLRKMSPTSLKLTLKQLEEGKKLDLQGCLKMV